MYRVITERFYGEVSFKSVFLGNHNRISSTFQEIKHSVVDYFLWTYETLCVIWYHFYNLKNVKYVHEGVLLLVILQTATLLKVTLLHGWFSRFLNCTNGTKSCKASSTLKIYHSKLDFYLSE